MDICWCCHIWSSRYLLNSARIFGIQHIFILLIFEFLSLGMCACSNVLLTSYGQTFRLLCLLGFLYFTRLTVGNLFCFPESGYCRSSLWILTYPLTIVAHFLSGLLVYQSTFSEGHSGVSMRIQQQSQGRCGLYHWGAWRVPTDLVERSPWVVFQ